MTGWTTATFLVTQAGSTGWARQNAAAAVGDSRGAGGTDARQGPRAGDLGPDAFFRLLAAQLKYQNPLEPMRDTEFIAQLAQFTQLDETRAMRETMARFAALSLLGRAVAVTTTAGETRGTVTGVFLDQGDPALAINGTRIPWADILTLRLMEKSTGAAVNGPAAAAEASEAEQPM